MKLFQFWDADPPADVLALMDDAREATTGFDYVRLDARSGRAFVADHYGTRGLAVWDACALPMMRSSYLRLLLMDTHCGIYADATYRFGPDFAAFVAGAPVAQMPFWAALTGYNYLMFRAPGNLFIRACIDLLVDNVEQRRMRKPLMAAGMGVVNAVRWVVLPRERRAIDHMMSTFWPDWGWDELVAAAERLIAPTPELLKAYRSIKQVPVETMAPYATSERRASHRDRDDHWLKWTGDIYR